MVWTWHVKLVIWRNYYKSVYWQEELFLCLHFKNIFTKNCYLFQLTTKIYFIFMNFRSRLSITMMNNNFHVWLAYYFWLWGSIHGLKLERPFCELGCQANVPVLQPFIISNQNNDLDVYADIYYDIQFKSYLHIIYTKLI